MSGLRDILEGRLKGNFRRGLQLKLVESTSVVTTPYPPEAHHESGRKRRRTGRDGGRKGPFRDATSTVVERFRGSTQERRDHL